MSKVSYSHFQKSRSAIVIIFLLLMLCKLLMCATWPSSSSSQTNVYIEKYTFGVGGTFTGYDTTSYGVVQGTKDYATFYLDYVHKNIKNVISSKLLQIKITYLYAT